MRYAVLFLSVLLSLVAKGQDFELMDLGPDLEFFASTEYGNGVSLFDVNQDGWADITLCRHGLPVAVLLNDEGTFSEISFELGPPVAGRHFNWVDIDNDGDADGCLTTFEGFVYIFEQVAPLEFIDVTPDSGMENSVHERYSNTWGDIDLDGDLDCYIPVYEITTGENAERNELYRNEGDFNFIEIAQSAGVDDGFRPSFMGSFIDHDNDLDPDIFVNNDRSFAPNSLYRNTNGTFQDVSEISGVAYHFLPMSNTVVDYNNDGNQDIFMSNNPDGCQLLKNIGGEFIDVTDDAGLGIFEFGWAGNFLDFDNDGDLDFHYSSMPFWAFTGQNRLYENDGYHVFSEVTEEAGIPIVPSETYCSGVADINMDGAMDLIVYNDEPQGLEIFLNQAPTNNWIKVRPHGVISNTDAIGTRIECYAGSSYQTKYTMCGEGFLGQNSDIHHFGILNYEVADSVVVTFPSGIVKTLYNVESGAFIEVPEYAPPSITISLEGSGLGCVGDSFELSVNEISSANWSNGESGGTITISSSGSYYATTTSILGETIYSDTITIVIAEFPDINLSLTEAECPGDVNEIAVLPESPFDEIEWDATWPSGWFEGELPPGEYSFTVTNQYGCSSSHSIALSEIPELYTEVIQTPVTCHGGSDGSVEIVLGEFPNTEVTWFSGNPDSLSAGNYAPLVWAANGCSEILDIEITEPDPLTPLVEVSHVLCHGEATGAAMASATGGNGEYEFDWQGVDPASLSQGDYSVHVTDILGCEASTTFNIDEPDPLEFTLNIEDIDVQTYWLSAIPSGGTPPYTTTWLNGGNSIETNDPIIADQYVEYEVVITDANGCEVSGVYTTINSNHYVTPWTVWPNPTSNELWVKGVSSGAHYRLINAVGQVVLEGVFNQSPAELSLHELPQGWYMLQVTDDNFERSQRVLKQ